MGASETPRPAPKSGLMIRLAQQLTARTLSGDIKWGIADRSAEKFIYSLTDSSVILSSDSLNFMGPDPIITLDVRGESGISLDTLSTVQPAVKETVIGIKAVSEPPQNQVLRDLYHAVRSQALQPEIVIRRILDELGGEEADT